jgi:hypothetical protein
MKPKIDPSFWSDPEVESLASNQKLALLWIWTNSQMTVCGFCQVSPKRFAFETGLPIEALWETIKALPRALKHFQDESTIYSRKFIRHQLGDGEQLVKNNIFKSVLSVFDGIRIKELKAAILEDYPVIGQRIKALQSPLKDKGEGEGEGEGEGKGDARGKCIPPTLLEVKAWAKENDLPESEADQFWHFYESKAWCVGKNKMKSWHGAAGGWKVRWKKQGGEHNPGNQLQKDPWKMTDEEILREACR